MIELLLPKSSHVGEPLGDGCETNIATVKSMLRVVRRLSGDNEFLSAVALQDAVATQSVVRKGEVRELSARIGGSMQTPLLKPCVIVVGSLHHEAPLGQTLQGTPASRPAIFDGAELGYSQQRRAGQRLVGLHHLDRDARQALVPYRCVAQRVDYPGLKAAVQALAVRWKAQRVLVEDVGAGTGLVQELVRKVSGIIAVKPSGDKKSRMAVASTRRSRRDRSFCPNRPPGWRTLRANSLPSPAAVMTISVN